MPLLLSAGCILGSPLSSVSGVATDTAPVAALTVAVWPGSTVTGVSPTLIVVGSAASAGTETFTLPLLDTVTSLFSVDGTSVPFTSAVALSGTTVLPFSSFATGMDWPSLPVTVVLPTLISFAETSPSGEMVPPLSSGMDLTGTCS